jgi:hypothetical protein
VAGVRAFKLFLVGSGFSNTPSGGRGFAYTVAARSRYQAYRLAYAESWAAGHHNPQGIVEIDTHEPGGGRYWWRCGCVQEKSSGLLHGDGTRIVAALIRDHELCQHDHPPTMDTHAPTTSPSGKEDT